MPADASASAADVAAKYQNFVFGGETVENARQDPLEERVLREMEQLRMTEPGSHVVAGISGGADSVSLLRILHALRERLRIRITVVHVEHGLRGEEALADADFTESLCRKLAIPCHVEHADVKSLTGAGVSLEEAGRKVRYAIFEQYREKLGAQYIAVAHNADDQAETMLLNLCRGTGIKGMGAMRRISGRIIRPLLGTRRQEIEEYLRRLGQPWKTDGSNLTDEYARNRLRHKVMPALEEVHEGAVSHLCQAAGRLQEAERYMEKQAALLLENCAVWGKDGRELRLDTVRLQKEDVLLQEYVIREALSRFRAGGDIFCPRMQASAQQTWLQNSHPEHLVRVQNSVLGGGLKDISSVHIGQLVKLAGMPCGKRIDLPAGLQAWKEDGRVCLAERLPADASGKRPDEGVRIRQQENIWENSCPDDAAGKAAGAEKDIREASGDEELWNCWIAEGAEGFDEDPVMVTVAPAEWTGGEIPQKKYTKWLCYDTMKGRLTVRTRMPGDYLVVNGSGGRKKLKDYMIDEKIPGRIRGKILLLAQGSHILWVVGYRISEAAKVRCAPEGTWRIIKADAGTLSES